MSMVTPKQLAKAINVVAESGVDSDQFQSLLGSGKLTWLLRRFMQRRPAPKLALPRNLREFSRKKREPVTEIIPLDVPPHGGVSLFEMIETGEYGGNVNPNFNEENFPMGSGPGLLLVCFNRVIEDDEDPTKSELLQEIDKLDLQPEGPFELATVGRCFSRLERVLPIAARRQIWRNTDGIPRCPIMHHIGGAVHVNLRDVNKRWKENAAFLASHK